MKCRIRRAQCLGLAAFALVAGSGLPGCMPPVHRPVMRHSIVEMSPAATFPARNQLEAVAAAPIPVPEGDGSVSVERWTLEESTLTRDPAAEASPEQAPWKEAVKEAAEASKRHLKPWQPLDCLAEQAGRFALANGGDPDARLVRFMAARCGAYAPDLRVHAMLTAVPADVPNDKLVESWGTKFSGKLLTMARKAPVGSRLGVWFARDEHRAGVVMATAHVEVTLGPLALAEDGRVMLTGRVLSKKKVRRVNGFINQGPRGFAVCTADPDRTPPHFRLRCPFAPNDTEAWVEIIAAPEEGLLEHAVARVLARRAPNSTFEYQARTGPQVPVTSAEGFQDAVLPELNKARAQVGLAPLALVRSQSQTNTRVAPALFDAERNDDTEKADMIALGLLAGWDVPAVIRDASIITKAAPGTSDALGWLEDALESPSGRSVLLSSDTAAIAFGATVNRGVGGLGVVATTYKFFGADECAKAKESFLDTLGKARAARGVPPVVLMNSAPLVEQANEIRDHLKHPQDALDEAVYAITSAYSVRVNGFYTTGLSLERAEIPEFLLVPRLELAIAVNYVRVPGAAWGQYVALIIISSRSMEV
jgi:hypothetical protein